MEGMKTLIFGGTGFIGSNVMRYFLKNGNEIHTMIRHTSNKWRIDDLINQINIHEGDLKSDRRIESVVSSVRPDIVINCSGLVKGYDIDDQEGVIQENFQNTVNLVNACVKSNVEVFINSGSAKECGYSEVAILNDKCGGNPVGLYGIVKKAERLYVDMISKKYKKRYLTARLFTPFGYYDSETRLIPYVILSLIDKKEPLIRNSGGGTGFLIH